MIQNDKNKREEAIAWWNYIKGIPQRMIFLRYFHPFQRNENSLTGSEIQNMWELENCPEPVIK